MKIIKLESEQLNIDNLKVSVDLLKNNTQFMAHLKKLSKQKATISIKSFREELGL